MREQAGHGPADCAQRSCGISRHAGRFGDLTRIEQDGVVSYRYGNARGRAGYDVLPGLADQPGRPLGPLALDELLRSQASNYVFRDSEFFWQASMLEPVGGMDHFFKGFLRQRARRGGTIAKLIRYGAKATAIETADDGVAIAYEQGGRTRRLRADFAISSIPMPIFKTLKTNLPVAFMDAAARLPTIVAGKVGWQAERFWETQDQIYGGISWTTDDITQIWYPSDGFLSPKGVLTGAYYYGDAPSDSTRTRLPSACRWRRSRASGCTKAIPDGSSTASPSAGTTWNSRASAGPTNGIRISPATPRRWRSRRGACTWSAIS